MHMEAYQLHTPDASVDPRKLSAGKATQYPHRHSKLFMGEKSSNKERVDDDHQKNWQQDLRLVASQLIQPRRHRKSEGNSS